MRLRLAAAAALVGGGGWSGYGAATEPEKPHSVGLKESVKVGLVVLEVTVWPKKADSDACLGLTADDFELRVDGKSHDIYAVDAMGSEQDAYVLPEGARAAAAAPSRGLSVVLLFDLYHLDVFYNGYDACPRTKPFAFREARRFVREGFHDGDRLLLITSAGWPVVHYGWISNREEALQALDRLEKNRQVIGPNQLHTNHLGWIAGMESLFLALGRYPGRKDVIYLGDDFDFDDVAMKMYEIAARAQANGVVVSAVDLLDSCRKIPVTSGGLGGTPWESPVALNPFSRDTGGQLFLADRIDSAVQALRTTRKCRYLVSFTKGAHKGKKAPAVTLSLKENRKDVTLDAPSSYETAERAPSIQEKDEALFLLPHFGKGIAADAVLWPYHPAGKKGRWRAFVLARVERTDDDPWPDELSEIKVNVVLHKRSEIYGEYTKAIAGDELTAFRTGRRSRMLMFPVEGVLPGEATVDVTVMGNEEGISANVRREFVVPKPPGPGEARPWFLSDRLVKYGDKEILAPSMDDAVASGQPFSFIGYGCLKKGEAPGSYEGRAVHSGAGSPHVPVRVSWLDPSSGHGDGCGWLLGQISSQLQPGLWTFEPPASLTPQKGAAAAVEFRVVSESGDQAPQPETRLK